MNIHKQSHESYIPSSQNISSSNINGIIVTQTGTYNIDYDAEYQARKQGKMRNNYEPQIVNKSYNFNYNELQSNNGLNSRSISNERSASGNNRIDNDYRKAYAFLQEGPREFSGDNRSNKDHNYSNHINRQEFNPQFEKREFNQSSTGENLPFPRRYAPQPQMPVHPSAYESLQIFKIDNQERSPVSMEPKRDASNKVSNQRNSKSPNVQSDKKEPNSAKIEELNLSHDQIVEEKAFMWACGRNIDGELAFGLNSSKEGEINIPRNIKQLRDFPVKSIAASNNHVVILTPHGDIHVAGSSLHGKLGIIGIEKKFLNKFYEVTQLTGQKVSQICCSDYATLLLVDTFEGRKVLFLGGPNMKEKNQGQNDLNELAEVKGDIQGKDIVQISCGDYHGAAVDSLGSLYTWGGGKTAQFNKGQCGHGNTEFLEKSKKVEALAEKRVKKVSCGAFHTIVLTVDNYVYTFGSGIYGECGHGDYGNLNLPKRIEIPKNKNKGYQQEKLMKDLLKEVDNKLADFVMEQTPITDISAGAKHSIVLAGNGSLYTFGFGGQGQLGHRNTDNQKVPTLVQDFDGVRIQNISAGSYHSVVQTSSGDIYSCGLNKDGQLGIGNTKSKTLFTHLTCFAGINIQKFLAAGNHTWFQIDEFLPFSSNYKYPNQLGKSNKQDLRKSVEDKQKDLLKFNKNQNSSENRQKGQSQDYQIKQIDNFTSQFGQQKVENTEKPKKVKEVNQKILSNQKIVEKILDIQKIALENARFYLQLTYCDTSYCHRFVHFEVDVDFIEQFEPILNEYIDHLKAQENEGILHYHLQEMPNKKQFEKLEIHKKTNQNKKQPKKSNKKAKKGNLMIRDLFGDIMEEAGQMLSDYSDSDNQKQSNNEESSEENKSQRDEDEFLEQREKSYTLTIICDPEESGIEKHFKEYKRWLIENKGASALNKQKRIVINANGQEKQSASTSGSLLLSPIEDDAFRKQNTLVGKVVFLKDREIETNGFERICSKWVSLFYNKMSELCSKKPRFSEMRPLKFNI